MDLVHYEPSDPSDPQGRLFDSTAEDRRDVQDQAAAWLRKAVSAIVPGLAAWVGRAAHGHS